MGMLTFVTRGKKKAKLSQNFAKTFIEYRNVARGYRIKNDQY
jgi:hypothetical protein